MKDSEKILLAVYAGVKDLSHPESLKYVQHLMHSFSFDDSVKIFYITDKNSNVDRIELLNPSYVDSNLYQQTLENLNKFLENQLQQK